MDSKIELLDNIPTSKGLLTVPKLPAKPAPEVIYPVIEVRMFHASKEVMKQWDSKAKSGCPLDLATAKELLGWQTEKDAGDTSSQKVTFGNSFLLEDSNGDKVRCLNNLTNRPYYPQLADDWKLEILRRKWKFNGETIIVDKYGGIHDGQHRLIGLALAVEEWLEDQKLPKDEQQWQELWPEEPYLEGLVVLGIEPGDETVNTIGTGKPRTLIDVLYRSKWFEGKNEAERKQLAKITSWAVKLLWDRTAQKDASFAPRRPHSESLDFIARHERLLRAVRFICDEGLGNEKFTHFIPLGYAAGLMYLMGCATSDVEAYMAVNSEAPLDWKLWDKAEKFWTDLAANGKATESLREALLKIPESIGGSFARDLRCGLVIKAWNLFSDGEKITLDKIEMEISYNELQQPFLAETPKIGGIDVDYSPVEKKPKEKKDKPKEAPAKTPTSTSYGVPTTEPGECIKGGDHEYTVDEDDGSEYCAKCLDPRTVSRTKPKKGAKK